MVDGLIIQVLSLLLLCNELFAASAKVRVLMHAKTWLMVVQGWRRTHLLRPLPVVGIVLKTEVLLVSCLLLSIIGRLLLLLRWQLTARVLVTLPRRIIVRWADLRSVAVMITAVLMPLLGRRPLLMHRRRMIVAHLATLVVQTTLLVRWEACEVTSAVAFVKDHVR